MTAEVSLSECEMLGCHAFLLLRRVLKAPNTLFSNLKNEVTCFEVGEGLPVNETVISEVFSGALGLLSVRYTGSRMF